MVQQKFDLSAILHKEMSRKEFLRTGGAVFLGIIGVTGLVQNLNKIGGPTLPAATQIKKTSGSGYGMSPYGR